MICGAWNAPFIEREDVSPTIYIIRGRRIFVKKNFPLYIAIR